MAVPPLGKMIEPLLLALASSLDGLTSRQAQDSVATRLDLSAEDRAITVVGGRQLLFRHRTNWAHDRPKRARLSVTPQKGIWKLTAEGIKVAEATVRGSHDALHCIMKTARDHVLPTRETSDEVQLQPASEASLA